MDVPIPYRFINLAQAVESPSGVQTLDNLTAAFYSRYLMKRAISAVKLTIPDEWDADYAAYTLFCRGFGIVVDVPKFGVIFQGASLYGRNVYYQPTRAITANPLYDPRRKAGSSGKTAKW